MKNVDNTFNLVCYALLMAGIIAMALGNLEYGIYVNTLVLALKIIPISYEAAAIRRENREKNKN